MKNEYLTKRVIILIFFLIGAINLNAQMVYIPDANFRTKLTNLGYGSCIVGDSIDSSCPAVANATSLHVTNVGIHDLQGIQAFVNLQTLYCGNDSLTSLPTLPVSLNYLECGNNQLTSLGSLPASLGFLFCENNQLTSISSLPNSLHHLYCYSNQISSMVLPNSMAYLDLSHNLMTSISVLPTSLVEINCSYNQLSTLPSLPATVTKLICFNNNLSSLPNFPISMTYLSCSSNPLTSLPNLPPVLNHLECFNNSLTSLVFPNTLTYIDCGSNPLLSLPSVPPMLTYLRCSNNQLSTLPVLPNSLTTLICSGNQLTNLVLPPALDYLDCSGNPLTGLPSLPASLTTLSCMQDGLTSLPNLPGSLTYLYCTDNLLTSIPDFPDTMTIVYLNNNPNLGCLPELKRIQHLDFSNTSVACIPNYGNISWCVPALSSLPICGVFNPNGCSSFYNISGKSYFDSNMNCSFEAGDVNQQNMNILLYKNGNLIQQLLTGNQGLYSFDVHDSIGAYTVQLDTSNIPLSVLCPSSIHYNDTITATDSIFSDNDFALKCKAGFDIGAMSIIGFPFRPAHTTTIHIQAGDISNFYGAHCASGISGSVTIAFTGSISYVSPAAGSLSPSSILGNTFTYQVSNFGNVNFDSDFNIVVATDTSAMVGSQICFTVSVMSAGPDNNLSNNVLTHCFTVVGSYDPNEKEVSPIGNLDPFGNRWLTYTIHFQNTGTAAAENIYVDDTLDSHLDLATFRLLAYSYQPVVQILQGGIARFSFPNINLPDSNTNEPASHGYVQYKIKLKDNAPVGTQVSNTAYIYFDFNAPVITNTTMNTVNNAVGIATINNDLQVSVFPNPTRNEFVVQSSKFRVGQKMNLKLTDVVGKELVSETMRSANCRLSTAGLPSGIYFLRIETEDGVVVKKLVKE